MSNASYLCSNSSLEIADDLDVSGDETTEPLGKNIPVAARTTRQSSNQNNLTTEKSDSLSDVLSILNAEESIASRRESSIRKNLNNADVPDSSAATSKKEESVRSIEPVAANNSNIVKNKKKGSKEIDTINETSQETPPPHGCCIVS